MLVRMHIVLKRNVSLILIGLFLVMQAGNAWAVNGMSMHVSDSAAPVVVATGHDAHHGMAHMPTGGVYDAASDDAGCDDQMGGTCTHCAHCVAMVIEAVAIAATVSLPYVDQVLPFINSVQPHQFKPPRFS